MKKLDYNKASPDDLIELTLSDDEFSKLWNAGIFALINDKCGTLITDYEDDQIVDIEALKNLIIILEAQKTNEAEDLVQKIINIFKTAVSFGTGVFFFF